MKNQIVTVLILQYFLGGIYLVVMAFWDAASTASALTGCAAALVPKTYSSLRMLRTDRDTSAEQWLGYAYRTEIGKWVIMAAIFAAAFSTDYPWEPVVLFAGFALIQLSGGLAPIVIKGN